MLETLGYNKEHSNRDKHDYYATPPEEVMNILQYEELKGVVLEPCCGEGHMVQGIIKSGAANKIIATDLIDRGFGRGPLDFLSNDYPYTDADTVIMNPPFKLLEEFVVKGLQIAKYKVILLARNQFLESESRFINIFKNNPPNRIYQYVDRISCSKGGDFSRKQGSSMSYSWFVWDWDKKTDKTELKWIRRWDKQKKRRLKNEK